MAVLNRRRVITSLAVLVCPTLLHARESVPVVGVVVTHAPPSDVVFELLREGMREYGWRDGENIRLEVVSAAGQMHRVPEIAVDFVRRNVAIIVAPNEPATRAAMGATRSIPIIMVGFGADPVALGLVDSFGRPKGNVTGIHALPDTLDAKRLQLLKEAVPSVKRVAVLWHAPFGNKPLEAIQQAGKSMGVTIRGFEVSTPDVLEKAFKDMKAGGYTGLMTTWSPVIYMNRDLIARLGIKYRLPTITLFANDGPETLMAYGTDLYRTWARCGYYIHRLLTGSRPADLPIEEISTFRMKVNMKTAQLLGVKFPQSILVQAQDVVE